MWPLCSASPGVSLLLGHHLPGPELPDPDTPRDQSKDLTLGSSLLPTRPTLDFAHKLGDSQQCAYPSLPWVFRVTRRHLGAL